MNFIESGAQNAYCSEDKKSNSDPLDPLALWWVTLQAPDFGGFPP